MTKQTEIGTRARVTVKWRELSANHDDLMRKIVNFIADGRGLNAFAKEHGVNFSTVWYWIDSEQSRRQAYESALLSGATFLAEMASEILMQEPRTLENGAVDNGWVSLMKARADQFKWASSKMFPGRFGDRQQVNITQTSISITQALNEAKQRVAGMAIDDLVNQPAIEG
jgi:hypothetical protein